MVDFMGRFLNLSLSVLLAVLVISVSADAQNEYITLNPDRTECFFVEFGDDGDGLYVMSISDPGLPDRPWVDTHSVKLDADSENAVYIPVCFSTEGRSIGDSAILNYRLRAPGNNISKIYGICVGSVEDRILTSSVRDPCEDEGPAYSFDFDIITPDRHASPGENVIFSLVISSDMAMEIELDKESGPSMDISATSVLLPGDYIVDASIIAPDETGDYTFVISARVAGCQDPECEKSVTGTVHVTEDIPDTFDVSLTPRDKNILGVKSVKYYLSINNDGDTQPFRIDIDTDDGIVSEIDVLTISVGKGLMRTVNVRVVPRAADSRLHTIRASVENEDGVKKIAEATLTIDRVPGDGPPPTDDPEPEDDDVILPPLTPGDDDEPEKPPEDEGVSPAIWYVIIVAVAAVAVVAFYIYRKSRVSVEADSQYFGGDY